MKRVLFIALLFMVWSGMIWANGHVDPPYLQIQSVENPITIDGKLDETDWMRRFDHLVFRSAFTPGDVDYSVTEELQVNGDMGDTTTTVVNVLHHGLDLYIALDSDDKSVCKWGGSWEGDGLFMKINDGNGIPVEFKLYFNAAGSDPDIVFELPGTYPTSGEGAGWKKAGTIVNDTTADDFGYTAEMVIHLDELGYSDPYADVNVLFNIFDPDGQTGTAGEEWNIGSYHKSWWGSEWGPDMRILRLADPPLRHAVDTDVAITLDGELNEAFWTDAEMVVVGKGSNLSSGGYYSQWGDPANEYTDQSKAEIKFASNGSDLYIGVTSDDASVCKWSPGWEADGLFLWMTYKGDNAPAARNEIKAMYFNQVEGAGISFETSAGVPTGAAEGVSFEPEGTVTHSGANGPDAGYSLEVVVHTDLFGYTENDTVWLSTVIWDLDYASVDEYDAAVADYYPNWWGTQWCDVNFEKYFMYRQVVLNASTTDVERNGSIAVKGFHLSQNYPNPFNPETNINYQLCRTSQVKVEVYDIFGHRVNTLINSRQEPGDYRVMWNGLNETGSRVSSGIYFCKLTTPDFSSTRKMIMMK